MGEGSWGQAYSGQRWRPGTWHAPRAGVRGVWAGDGSSTRALAIELAIEQAEEFRRPGLAYQLDTLHLALHFHGDAARWCLHFVRLGRTEIALRELAIPGLDVAVRHATRTLSRRRSRRR
jgi:hypothetical protein